MKPTAVVDVITERLKQLMREHSIKAAPLARAADLNESAVRDILRGRSKNPGIVTLEKIASVLDLRPSALFEAGALWTITGDINDGTITESNSDGPQYAVENPFFLRTPENLIALHVHDDSLAPFAFTDDFLVFSTSPTNDDSSATNRPCICELKDGRRLVRLVRPDEKPNLVTLLPVNPYAPAEKDVVTKSYSPVLFVLPSSLANKTVVPTHEGSGSVHEKQQPFKSRKR